MSHDHVTKPCHAQAMAWAMGMVHGHGPHIIGQCFLSTFAFFHHTNDSVISGVPIDRFDPALLDLSTVANHSGQYFNYADVPAMAAEGLLSAETRMVSGTSLIFNRFHPDNLMHVLHDDLLPLYATLKLITRRGRADMTPFDVQLVVMDGRNPGQFQHLYNMFSTREALYKTQLQGHRAAICFADVYVGLSKETQLSVKLAATLGVRVWTLSLEEMPLEEIIKRIRSAAVVVGMHGSLLTLAMFMLPGSILIELFPYAVNPLHYTPYSTLASLPGMAVTYRAWRNMDPNRSVTHPSAAPEVGGIDHLERNEQDRIMCSPEVPLHLCCKDPEWLFRIYQDTIVDVPAVIALTRDAVDEHASATSTSFTTASSNGSSPAGMPPGRRSRIVGVLGAAMERRLYPST
ncbi:Protein O-linked-mannose beta-1,4-N-acetylglucosaminyltransferase 2 [Lamellibrachia satsuma]|nr:Protein O-linked-mannose beta-1,4-N-acetylglucosaminyltransferase 2 [Lamellibrachia satsuma]